MVNFFYEHARIIDSNTNVLEHIVSSLCDNKIRRFSCELVPDD